MNDVEVRKGFDSEGSPEYPYSVTLLIDCSFDNLDEGMSEISWFATESEQKQYFKEVMLNYYTPKF